MEDDDENEDDAAAYVSKNGIAPRVWDLAFGFLRRCEFEFGVEVLDEVFDSFALVGRANAAQVITIIAGSDEPVNVVERMSLNRCFDFGLPTGDAVVGGFAFVQGMIGDAVGAQSEFGVFDESLPRRDGRVEAIGNNSEGNFVARISKGNSAPRAEGLRIHLSPGRIG